MINNCYVVRNVELTAGYFIVEDLLIFVEDRTTLMTRKLPIQKKQHIKILRYV